jgi:type II secretory pathway pseudopilin PulG
LAELLTVLSVLSVIASISIPKVLTAQANQKYNATAKEALSALANAYTLYRQNNLPNASTSVNHLLPYFNYVKRDTAASVQDNWGNVACDGSNSVCLQLANGGIIRYDTGCPFMGTTPLNAIEILFDPDGAGGTAGAWFGLYFNGRVTSLGRYATGTLIYNVPRGVANPNDDPAWLKWN